ncbi:MAG: hypothetical protein WCF57_07770, partial [Pyrinomonadaceae bacterium]
GTEKAHVSQCLRAFSGGLLFQTPRSRVDESRRTDYNAALLDNHEQRAYAGRSIEQGFFVRAGRLGRCRRPHGWTMREVEQ